MAHVCILYAVENQAFASKIERVLHEMDHAVSRREVDGESCAILGAAGGKPDAMVVIWSTKSIASPTVIAEAREAVARRTLTPVAIGKIEPPASFQHLWPIDLSGWTGSLEDPRWRFVTDEINLSIRRSEMGFEDLTVESFSEEPEEERRGVSGRVVLFGAAIAISALAISLIGLAPMLFGGKDKDGEAPGVAFVEPAEVGVDAPEAGAADPVSSENSSEEPSTDESSPDLMTVTPAPTIAMGETAPADDPLSANENDISETAAAPAMVGEASAEAEDVFAQESSATGDDTEPLVITAVKPGEEAIGEDETAGVADGIADDGQTENIVVAEAPSLKPAAAVPPAAETTPPTDDEFGDDPLAETIAVATAEDAAAVASEDAAPDDLDRLIVESTVLAEQENAYLGNYFRECVFCPDMAALQGGSFVMGSPADERARQDTELLAREATIPYRFAIGTREVTYEQWDACVDAGACRPAADPGWGRGKRPVVNVSWSDAQDYVKWLSLQTGQEYRLPTEAEWEYAARAGASTPFSFGRGVSPQQANFNGKYGYGASNGLYRGRTTPVASFAPNAFGLFDMHGNVWEWTSDCWPQGQAEGCDARVLKGGAWNTGGWRLRAGHRIGANAEAREFDNGFRVARTLP